MEESFRGAGANVETLVFKTLSLKDMEDSYKVLAEKIKGMSNTRTGKWCLIR